MSKEEARPHGCEIGLHLENTYTIAAASCSGEPQSLTPREHRYHDALRSLPIPGGNGCHSALLGVANRGLFAGVTPAQIFGDLRSRIDVLNGTRRVSDREIRDAIDKALNDRNERPQYRLRRRERANRDSLRRIIEDGQGANEADIWEASPVRIDWPPKEDAARVLEALYGEDELLCIGGPFDAGREHIRSASEWAWDFMGGATVPPHIIPNPLTGEQGKTKDGKPSFRADSCVASFRFTVVESDSLSLDDQVRFWAAVKLPVAALIHSGGKSIHGWVRVDCEDAEDWTETVEHRLYGRYLTPMGFDPACQNETRLSRLPGHLRAKDHWQRILYLAPEGRAVA